MEEESEFEEPEQLASKIVSEGTKYLAVGGLDYEDTWFDVSPARLLMQTRICMEPSIYKVYET